MNLLPARAILAIAAVADIAAHQAGGLVRSKDIADRLGLAPRRLEPVLQAFGHAEIIASVRGPKGGYRLVKPAHQITLLSIAEAVAETSTASDPEFVAGAKRVDRIVDDLAKPFRHTLTAWSVADLNAPKHQREAA